MTNLQKIQQETEKIFFNKYPVGMETIDFIHSRESIAYEAGLEEVREKVEKLDLEKMTKGGLLREVLTLIDEEINKAA